ncbi:hypothetical protein C2R22_12630 [Salinigranum rubrum]|uniref:DUF211 domain-containing protein n=1 Tax=Salinigranum rubrum TaxID=755307 RepID=A0A2I8VKC3_9EURY|nr:DUF211 domain-containing protein [Salinigranum rubrum]AUV82383.1 hypothetical protein C2R22_12630 [Salinigranum rubrum]
MASIRRLVLDVLKPVEVATVSFARELSDLDGVDATAVRLVETDREVQNVTLVVEGEAVDFERVEACIESLGGTLHSVDEVVCGEFVPEEHVAHADATWLR